MSAPPLQLPLFKPPVAWRAPAGPPPSTWLDGVRRLSVDTERRDERLGDLGPGTYRGDAHLVGLSVATDAGFCAYFPTRHEGGGNCEWDVAGWAADQLNRFAGELVGANVGYDLESLEEWGVTFPLAAGFHDVLLAEPIIDEWELSYSLEAAAARRLGEGKAQSRLLEVGRLHGWRAEGDVKRNLWRLHAGDVGEYAEADADLPLRMLPVQLDLIERDGQGEVYDLERGLIPVTHAMRRRGVLVAPPGRVAAVRERFTRERERWLAEVRRLAGPGVPGLHTSPQLAGALSDRGLHVPRTAKGKPSIEKVFLERNKGDALVDAVAAGRRVGTIIDLTVDSIVAGTCPDGRVHSSWNQLRGEDESGKKRGTIARYSSSNFNLQQIPTRQSEFDELLFDGAFDVTKEIRGLFLPEDGEVFESDDESQIEFRLLTNWAIGPGAEEARERYRSDPSTDFHKMAAELLRVDPEDSKRRKRVKNTNFAKSYGAGVDQLAATFNCPVEEAERFNREYDRGMPFVSRTFGEAKHWASRNGFVTTVLGRKCRFPLWEPAWTAGAGYRPAYRLERAREAYPGERLVRARTKDGLNRKLQGSGADILKKAMLDAHRAGVTAALGPYLMTVHDELCASVPRTRVGDEAAAELRRIMEHCVDDRLKVPLRVSSERGPSWGEVGKWQNQ